MIAERERPRLTRKDLELADCILLDALTNRAKRKLEQRQAEAADREFVDPDLEQLMGRA